VQLTVFEILQEGTFGFAIVIQQERQLTPVLGGARGA
jgi:hypothetical protein